MPWSDPEKNRQARRDHYEANKPAYFKRAVAYKAAHRSRLRAIVAEAKSQPCADCGGSFPTVCMDFDHGGSEKTDAIANMVNDCVSAKRLLAEIERCEVVCSNCHRLRTAAERLDSEGAVEKSSISLAS